MEKMKKFMIEMNPYFVVYAESDYEAFNKACEFVGLNPDLFVRVMDSNMQRKKCFAVGSEE